MKVIILGASRGIRRLDFTKSTPTTLKFITGSRRVLDWQLAEFARAGARDVVYVGGYHIEKVIQQYPRLRFNFDPLWESGGDVSALRCARAELSAPCLIVKADILFRSEMIGALAHDRAPLAAASLRAPSGRRLIGALWVGKEGLPLLKRRLDSWRPKGRDLARDLGWLAGALGRPIPVHDAAAWSAPAADSEALARFVLGTKAQTLERLAGRLKRARILEQLCFSVGDWRRDPRAVIERVRAFASRRAVVVRSSALAEDGWESSQAGRFVSVLGVDGAGPEAIRSAVERVIGGFGRGGRRVDPRDQVLVQPELSGVSCSGVLLTRELHTGAPYYVVNIGRATDEVTSGSGSNLRTAIVWRGARVRRPPRLRRLLAAAAEIENAVGHDSLDVEFAIDGKRRLYALQVRRLVTPAERPAEDADVAEEIAQVKAYVAEHSRPRPHLHGRTSLYSNMADWNPAEMIGVTPRPLSLSLYQEMIGDETWSYARALLGYRDVAPAPLILSLGGHAYVDVRASLNSFLPAAADPRSAAALIERQLSLLRRRPELHDKIEFEVALTCDPLDPPAVARELSGAGLAPGARRRFAAELRGLTEAIVAQRGLSIAGQLGRIGSLARRRQAALDRPRRGVGDDAILIYDLTSAVKRMGTLPFAVLARMAFVALTLLRSLRERGALAPDEYDAVLRAVPTVASRLAADMRRLSLGRMVRREFLELYGHLRPSSYNILSPNYRSAPGLYLGGACERLEPGASRDSSARRLLERRRAPINRLLRESGFRCDAQELIDFMLAAIPAREEAKFEFSKNLDAILEAAAGFGSRLGLSREDISFLPIGKILKLATDSPSCAVDMDVKREIGFNRKRHGLADTLRLPPLIAGPDCVEAFFLKALQPNFITRRCVTAPVAVFGPGRPPGVLEGKIVFIEQADPGYDWLFSRRIAGLVTMHGGAASHMAIRAAEFGLPAAIGCGEVLFERLRRAGRLTLDCAERRFQAVGVL